MIWEVAQSIDVDYGCWVKLFQSRYFAEEFPEDNDRFENVTYTDTIVDDRAESLLHMRKKMFAEYSFTAGIFIGGMKGIIAEFELLRKMHPEADIVPVVSTGGATIEVARRMEEVHRDLFEDLDYVAVFHRHLGISPREKRYSRPGDQPTLVEDRLWPMP